MSDPEQKPTPPGRLIALTLLIGALALAIFWAWYTAACEGGEVEKGWCGTVHGTFPWTLLTALASGPSVVLMWLWRERHRRADVATAQEQAATAGDQLNKVEKQLEIARDGQVTERFTRAIEQLGSEQMAVRLGGIYALERIMKDSPRDHWSIVETLAAFLRQRAARADYEGKEDSIYPTSGAGRWLTETFPLSPYIRSDCRGALAVLVRRNAAPEGPECVVDLREVLLAGATMDGAQLRRALLVNANLAGARLDRACLDGAVLSACCLRSASLREASLGKAKLVGTDLTGADLTGALGLTAPLLSKAKLDHKTRLPEELEYLVPERKFPGSDNQGFEDEGPEE